ncbi:7185_t:CDS:1, partial [Funneliformis caledonium]
VSIKTQVELNGKVFITRIIENNLKPDYCYQCDSLSSNVEESSTYAISSLYQSIFSIKTKFSETSAISLDNLQIIAELLADVKFRPFSVKVDKYQIFIYKLESSKQRKWLNARPDILHY